MDFQALLGLGMAGERILQFLIIDLQHGYSDHILLALGGVFDSLEDLIEGPWNDPHLALGAASLHGEGLPSPCLAVGEDRAVESLERGLDYWSCALVIDLLLGVALIVDQIIGKD